MSCKYAGEDCTVDEKLKEMIFKIGEKLSIRRFAVTEGITSTYIHGIGSIGVIVRFDTDVADRRALPSSPRTSPCRSARTPPPILTGIRFPPAFWRQRLPSSVRRSRTIPPCPRSRTPSRKRWLSVA